MKQSHCIGGASEILENSVTFHKEFGQFFDFFLLFFLFPSQTPGKFFNFSGLVGGGVPSCLRACQVGHAPKDCKKSEKSKNTVQFQKFRPVTVYSGERTMQTT